MNSLTKSRDKRKWLDNLSSGDEIVWNDPDGGACSYRGVIGAIERCGGVYKITFKDGHYLEAFGRELA